MALYKKLWIFVISLVLMSVVVSFLGSGLATKSHLSNQLAQQNSENANALALSLSQAPYNSTEINLKASALFDTGHYEYITVKDQLGNLIAERRSEVPESTVPAWFQSLFSIHSPVAISYILSDWKQAGEITLKSHTAPAYNALWNSATNLLASFLVIGILIIFIGGWVLNRILSPIRLATAQAENIIQNRFTVNPEEGPTECKTLITAMNTMSFKLKEALFREAGNLFNWWEKEQYDPITGLTVREITLSRIAAALTNADSFPLGAIALIRISGIFELNRKYSRSTVDDFLNFIGELLKPENDLNGSLGISGRLNGSDFILFTHDIERLQQKLSGLESEILTAANEHSIKEPTLSITIAAKKTQKGESLPALLKNLDTHLEKNTRPELDLQNSQRTWADMQSIELRKIAPKHYEVLCMDHSQQTFSPDWLLAEIPKGSLTKFINLLKRASQDIEKVTLSCIIPEWIASNPSYFTELIHCSEETCNAKKLHFIFELREPIAAQHLASLQKNNITPLKSKNIDLAIINISEAFEALPLYSDSDVQHLKLDRTLTHKISDSETKQVLIQGISKITNTLNMEVYGYSFESGADNQLLKDLGINKIVDVI